MLSLEIVYWAALGLGLGLLALSLILGDVFDFLDLDLPGDVSIVPVFFAAVAAFGAGGLFGLKAFGFQTGGSILLGLGGGVVMGGVTALLFAVLGRQEAKEGFETHKLIGLRGRLTLATGPAKIGKVQVTYEGMTRSLSATSLEEIPAGHDVKITDVVGRNLTVARMDKDNIG